MPILDPFIADENSSAHRREDAAVLAAVQDTLQGDTRAFQVIVEEYTPLLYSLALRMLGYRDDAEEAVQDIFLKVFKALPTFRLEKRFLPWVYTIAINFLRTFYKRRKRRRDVETYYPHEDAAARIPDRSLPDPSRRLLMEQAEAVAARALLKLRHQYRAVFVLRAIEGFSPPEVAAILGIPEGTVKTFFHRAKAQLVKLIFEETGETGHSFESI